MKIRYQLGVLILSSVCLTAWALHYSLDKVLQKTVLELENKNAETNIERLQSSITNKRDFLNGKIGDWARWDDTHEFVLGKRPKYIHENFRKPEEVFANLKVDYFAILNNDKDILYKASFNFEKGEITPKVDEYLDFFKSFKMGQEISGFFKSGNDILQIVAIPIVRTDLTGEPTGLFIAGYTVGPRYLEDLSQLTQLTVSATNPWGISDANFKRLNENQIQIQFPILNNSKTEELTGLEIMTERRIFQTFLNTTSQIQIILGLMFLFLIVAGALGVEFIIVRRLQNLGSFLSKLNISKLSQPVAHKDTSNDEVGFISKTVNSMISQIVEDKAYIEKQKSVLIHSERLKAVGEMAGGIAHEINNPLAIISGRVKQIAREALKTPVDKSKIQDLESKIESTIGRTTAIIRGLRTSVRQSDNDPIEVFSVNHLIQETLELCQPKATGHEVALKMNCETTQDFSLEGQRVPLSQVILNLVSNAIDEIVKQPGHKWVQVTSQISENTVQIRVIDSGKGIPPEVLPKLFQPFFTTKEVGKGTGLGLSIAKGIIEAHQGQLFVDSSHENTCFVIELPRKNSLKVAA